MKNEEQLTVAELRERLPHVADNAPEALLRIIYDMEGDRRNG